MGWMQHVFKDFFSKTICGKIKGQWEMLPSLVGCTYRAHVFSL